MDVDPLSMFEAEAAAAEPAAVAPPAPAGAMGKGQVVRVGSLMRWDETAPHELEPEDVDLAKHEAGGVSPFPIRHDLNQKIVLWDGSITSLDVDALVCSTNETLSERGGVAGRVRERAGPQMEMEIASTEGCRTGEAVLTRGCELHAAHVIYTVGPRYNVKYETAAENALHSCYRNCLRIVREHSLRSLAFCRVNLVRKKYPAEAAAHVAIRTTRRFLEQFGDTIDTVVFVTESAADTAIYQRLMGLYLPRNHAEEYAAIDVLPSDVGNADGEIIIEEREIQISSVVPTGDLANVAAMTGDALMTMQDDPDAARRASVADASAHKSAAQLAAEETERLYARCLEQGRETDLRDIAALNLVYSCGHDGASSAPTVRATDGEGASPPSSSSSIERAAHSTPPTRLVPARATTHPSPRSVRPNDCRRRRRSPPTRDARRRP
jgi:O-acetyl-ADP-ribose deacetylase (regulator of RNase III)